MDHTVPPWVNMLRGFSDNETGVTCYDMLFKSLKSEKDQNATLDLFAHNSWIYDEGFLGTKKNFPSKPFGGQMGKTAAGGVLPATPTWPWA